MLGLPALISSGGIPVSSAAVALDIPVMLAASVDLVVHTALDLEGRRRVREVVAVPGRVEGDVVEATDVFTTVDGALVRAGGFPPHEERFARAGHDVHALLAHLGMAVGVLVFTYAYLTAAV